MTEVGGRATEVGGRIFIAFADNRYPIPDNQCQITDIRHLR